jgi:hypothetical protein
MSKVPELDRLIEESENFRTNMRWRKRDRLFKLFMLQLIIIFPLFFLLFLSFGPAVSSCIISIYFFAICSFMLVQSFKDLFEDFLKDDWEGKDMTKRYNRK